MSKTHKIAIYGKGGVGKSVVAANLSVAFAKQKRSVLHLGCDPKHDSAVRLLEPGQKLKTVLEILGEDGSAASGEQVIQVGRLGIHCCESGGPQPGLGCGGRGVARTLEFLEEMEIIEAGKYQVVLFDVLGDVVCGGFAAPLRLGFAQKVVIVTSEEPMALYAANNISRAIAVYHHNGVALAGLVANLRGADADMEMIGEFAARLSTRVLATIPRDPKILEGERRRKTVLEHAPDSPGSRAIKLLARELDRLEARSLSLPSPMEDEEFYRFLEQW